MKLPGKLWVPIIFIILEYKPLLTPSLWPDVPSVPPSSLLHSSFPTSPPLATVLPDPPLGLLPGFPVCIPTQRSISTPRADSVFAFPPQDLPLAPRIPEQSLSCTTMHTGQALVTPTFLASSPQPRIWSVLWRPCVCLWLCFFVFKSLSLSVCFNHAWNECSHVW